MVLSDELKQWGYHSSISDEGKKQHLEMAEVASKLEAEQKFRHKRGCKSWIEDTGCACGLLISQERNRKLKSENAELKKYLKHARDDKEIRLNEIEVLEGKVVELADIKALRNAEIGNYRLALAASEKREAELREAFESASKRISVGNSKRLLFRCAHCEKDTPLLIDGLLDKANQALKETPNENPPN